MLIILDSNISVNVADNEIDIGSKLIIGDELEKEILESNEEIVKNLKDLKTGSIN